MRGNRRSILGLIETDAARFTYIDPTALGVCGLWYDWSLETPGSLSTVTDRSGSGRTGTLTDINCVDVASDYGPYGSMLDDDARIQFTNINLRTVIRAFVAAESAIFLMADSSNYKFHSAGTAGCSATFADAAVKNGAWRVNGRSLADPTAPGSIPEYPGVPVVVSVVTTGLVDQDRIGFERSYNRSPQTLMESLVFTDALSVANVKRIEHYLALKWNIIDYVF